MLIVLQTNRGRCFKNFEVAKFSSFGSRLAVTDQFCLYRGTLLLSHPSVLQFDDHGNIILSTNSLFSNVPAFTLDFEDMFALRHGLARSPTG